MSAWVSVSMARGRGEVGGIGESAGGRGEVVGIGEWDGESSTYVPECRRNTHSVSAIVPLVHMQFSGMVH